ncbi:MAG: cation:proton antiporter, partial [Chlamydiales bacterium]|nr:cation:proton antiporter [Chlamydiales bacterium]
MNDFESLVLLMTVAAALVTGAQKTNMPYPIVLVIGGALLSFIPGLDFTYFNPELILTIVLPPILHSAAFWTSLREFKQHARKICSLALGLVVVTTVVVA